MGCFRRFILDLHFLNAVPNKEEKDAVDSCLKNLQLSWTVTPENDERVGETALPKKNPYYSRHLLLPVFHEINLRIGWISPGALNYTCQLLKVAPAEAFGVADFYHFFSMKPRAPVMIRICDDLACMLKGAKALCQNLEDILGPTNSFSCEKKLTWSKSPCLGFCEHAPAALISSAGRQPWEYSMGDITAKVVLDQINERESDSTIQSDSIPIRIPQQSQSDLRILGRIGKVNPKSIDDHINHGGGDALKKAIEVGSEQVIKEVIDSRLVGRGGAAFPAGIKWESVFRSSANGQRSYLVCNADESEPGTFKDRLIMEGDPFLLIESMTIAALATGCKQGYIYIRAEYPKATEHVINAIKESQNHGFLGKKILGQSLEFNIELRRGAGAYICGEETALFNSIEGYRGEPRNKPPFPTEAGLFGQPTLVNNVETLLNIPGIILEGGHQFASIGTAGSTGTKLFCLAGHVQNPGVYEVPFGVNLNEIIELAGGVSGSGRLQAVLLGGAAGTFLSKEELDIPLTFEATRKVGATLGSGAVTLFDDTVDLSAVLLRIADFFRDESCGQCVPCRIGTVRQQESLVRIFCDKSENPLDGEKHLLEEIGKVMSDASICGLGHTASNAIQSALNRWELPSRKNE